LTLDQKTYQIRYKEPYKYTGIFFDIHDVNVVYYQSTPLLRRGTTIGSKLDMMKSPTKYSMSTVSPMKPSRKSKSSATKRDFKQLRLSMTPSTLKLITTNANEATSSTKQGTKRVRIMEDKKIKETEPLLILKASVGFLKGSFDFFLDAPSGYEVKLKQMHTSKKYLRNNIKYIRYIFEKESLKSINVYKSLTDYLITITFKCQKYETSAKLVITSYNLGEKDQTNFDIKLNRLRDALANVVEFKKNAKEEIIS
jgi:hypothetical protein